MRVWGRSLPSTVCEEPEVKEGQDFEYRLSKLSVHFRSSSTAFTQSYKMVQDDHDSIHFNNVVRAQ